jgi:hypothetical protein
MPSGKGNFVTKAISNRTIPMTGPGTGRPLTARINSPAN